MSTRKQFLKDPALLGAGSLLITKTIFAEQNIRNERIELIIEDLRQKIL